MCAAFGDRVAFVETDIMTEAAIANAVAATTGKFGTLDILVSNAGAPTPGTVETMTEADFAYAMNLLLGSVLFGMKHAVPVMRAKRYGRIINTGSIAGLRSHMGGYLYSVAKAAVAHASRLAGIELARDGITVNTISPGAIATPIFYGGSTVSAGLEADHAAAKLRKLSENLAKATPRLVAGVSNDIAEAAVYLASQAAAHVNAHDLVVDGGMVAGGRVNYE
jgi:NAD(P)-dependent dehydrogenase (short-subunit alcohol dehydrogenase family)